MYNSVLCYLEKTVEKYPDKTAVVDKGGNITFKKLKHCAQIIASAISEKNVGVRKPVLVYLPKSRWSIVSFMGILYSRNFYTPTDVGFPFEKVKSILDCLHPVLIITDGANKGKLIKNDVSQDIILNIDELDFDSLQVVSNIDHIIDTDLVYTLFTSGSTGIPKGVAITNRSIIDYVDWVKDTYQVSDKDKIGNQAPFYFDNSTLDIYTALCTGATLYIIPETLFAFPAELMQYVRDHLINMVFWVPSVLINIANSDILSRIDCCCLNKILFAGEVMPNRHLNYWRRFIPEALYSNLYGPTEITVDCTYYIVDRQFEDDEPLPIGIPCRNSDVFILSEENTLIEKEGQIGELCVRGSSLAVGYLGNEEKTKEVFVQNPLNSLYKELIYKTGDLVYYNDRNEIMFVGRKDFQIKHMGYRIELGEIENAVMKVPEIGNACVIYDSQNKDIILCYEAVEDIMDKDIRRFLTKVIPKYMIPTKYRRYDSLPLTDNGKINRKLLESECIGD
ncbi:MAG TPA: hypothetical protein DHV96_12065 [Lachnospiraceae bacterium]|nr:hypothetical protein [Lachnospiraceae bacterium]